MSLDSEVPPSKYLDLESRENTKLLKSIAKKSSTVSNGQSTSHKLKSIANKVLNCQECLVEVDNKIQKSSTELKAVKEEFDKKLASVSTTVNAIAIQIPDGEKFKEVDVAVKEIYKKMAYIESIVLNLSKSFFDMNDNDLKNLITKQSGVEKVSVASNTKTDNTSTHAQTIMTITPTKPVSIPVPFQDVAKVAHVVQKQEGGTPTYSLQTRTHSISYDV